MSSPPTPQRKSTFQSRVGGAIRRSSTSFSILGPPSPGLGAAVLVTGPRATATKSPSPLRNEIVADAASEQGPTSIPPPGTSTLLKPTAAAPQSQQTHSRLDLRPVLLVPSTAKVAPAVIVDLTKVSKPEIAPVFTAAAGETHSSRPASNAETLPPASVPSSAPVIPGAQQETSTRNYFDDIPRSTTPTGLDSDPDTDVWADHGVRRSDMTSSGSSDASVSQECVLAERPSKSFIRPRGSSTSSQAVGAQPMPRSRMAPLDLTPYIVKLEDRYLEGGSFGDVYRCRYNGPGATDVAVKSFRFRFTLEEKSKTTHVVKMVRREVGIWRRLDHRNIVPFLGTATGFGMQGSLSLVSEWMPNGSLHSFLINHGEQLHTSHQFQFLWDIANGLDYLHSFTGSPIVHGDLNGNNVLLDGNFTARLVDFGYSTVVGSIPEALRYLQRSTARPGAIRWRAPELILAGLEEDAAPIERTPKSDIYSFGCTSLQVLSGNQPWSEVREEGSIAIRMFRGQKPKRPTSQAIDDSHWEFIQGCWSVPEERPTAGMLVAVIQDLLSACPQAPALRDMLSS